MAEYFDPIDLEYLGDDKYLVKWYMDSTHLQMELTGGQVYVLGMKLAQTVNENRRIWHAKGPTHAEFYGGTEHRVQLHDSSSASDEVEYGTVITLPPCGCKLECFHKRYPHLEHQRQCEGKF